MVYYEVMKIILLIFLIPFFLGNSSASDALIYELDWMMGEARRQVAFDRKKFNEVTGNDFLIVFWKSRSKEFLQMTPLINKLAKKVSGDYKAIAYNPEDEYPSIKSFKRQLVNDFFEPRKDIEEFLNTFTFIVDLDQRLPSNLYGASVPSVVIINGGEVKKVLKSSKEIEAFIKENSNKDKNDPL